MSIFGQLKGAQEMLKGMSPDQIKDLLEKAKESKGMMEDVIREEVEKAIKARNLVSREEVERMIRESK
jgi:ferritin-like protein